MPLSSVEVTEAKCVLHLGFEVGFPLVFGFERTVAVPLGGFAFTGLFGSLPVGSRIKKLLAYAIVSLKQSNAPLYSISSFNSYSNSSNEHTV